MNEHERLTAALHEQIGDVLDVDVCESVADALLAPGGVVAAIVIDRLILAAEAEAAA